MASVREITSLRGCFAISCLADRVIILVTDISSN